MADLLVAVMQDAARHVVQQQAEPAQQAQQQQAEQQQQQQADQAGQQQGAGSQATEKARQALPPVPGPMFPGNWESPDPTCRLGVSC